MGILTDAMKRCIERQRLGFVASASPSGVPNLSPKGSLAVWDDDTLVFADTRSPATVRNLVENPAVEINVVDPLSRAGWRFKGHARVLVSGPTWERVRAFYAERGLHRPFEHVVFVRVERAAELRSPAYDDGTSEAEIRAHWQARWRAAEQETNEAAPESGLGVTGASVRGAQNP